jgi:hypothetical protein
VARDVPPRVKKGFASRQAPWSPDKSILQIGIENSSRLPTVEPSLHPPLSHPRRGTGSNNEAGFSRQFIGSSPPVRFPGSNARHVTHPQTHNRVRFHPCCNVEGPALPFWLSHSWISSSLSNLEDKARMGESFPLPSEEA